MPIVLKRSRLKLARGISVSWRRFFRLPPLLGDVCLRETLSLDFAVAQEEEEDDDGNVSDPPPMEYDANRDREINEDPDQSDGGDGAGGADEEVGVVVLRRLSCLVAVIICHPDC